MGSSGAQKIKVYGYWAGPNSPSAKFHDYLNKNELISLSLSLPLLKSSPSSSDHQFEKNAEREEGLTIQAIVSPSPRERPKESSPPLPQPEPGCGTISPLSPLLRSHPLQARPSQNVLRNGVRHGEFEERHPHPSTRSHLLQYHHLLRPSALAPQGPPPVRRNALLSMPADCEICKHAVEQPPQLPGVR